VLDAADDSVAGGVAVEAEIDDVCSECAGSDGRDVGGGRGMRGLVAVRCVLW
jgi:hypothetical protein